MHKRFESGDIPWFTFPVGFVLAGTCVAVGVICGISTVLEQKGIKTTEGIVVALQRVESAALSINGQFLCLSVVEEACSL